MEIVVALTGASGIIYGINLLKILQSHQNTKIHLIISESAKQLINFETKFTLDNVITFAHHYYENSDLAAIIASGSKLIDGMVIVPCSMSTAAKINTGITDNLITRAADVCFKERRKLIIVPRETPLSTTHLKNLFELSEKGAVVIPAMPAYYPRPESIEDMINFITGKILDNLGQKHNLYTRWPGGQ
jgi:4-hydroxy-3-polyprenylbenzoate decarboxylase